jgi:hypothetical protein
VSSSCPTLIDAAGQQHRPQTSSARPFARPSLANSVVARKHTAAAAYYSASIKSATMIDSGGGSDTAATADDQSICEPTHATKTESTTSTNSSTTDSSAIRDQQDRKMMATPAGPGDPAAAGSDSERRYRPQKYCAVCGDKAIACNFNAVTCESCKAFFRRNAFKEQRLRCLFENRCVIDRVTRRFCSKCRLLKCLQIGMKREWILTDEQKQIKRVKIMQNKRSRQLQNQQQVTTTQAVASCTTTDEIELSRPSSGSTSSGGGTCPTQIDEQQVAVRPPDKRQRIGAGRRPHHTETRDAATCCPDEKDLLSGLVLPYCSLANQCQFCSFRLVACQQHQPHHVAAAAAALAHHPAAHPQLAAAANLGQQHKPFQQHQPLPQPQPPPPAPPATATPTGSVSGQQQLAPGLNHNHYQQIAGYGHLQPAEPAYHHHQLPGGSSGVPSKNGNCYNFGPPHAAAAAVVAGQLALPHHQTEPAHLLHHHHHNHRRHYHHHHHNNNNSSSNSNNNDNNNQYRYHHSPNGAIVGQTTQHECCCSNPPIQHHALPYPVAVDDTSGPHAGGSGGMHLHMIEMLQARVHTLNTSITPDQATAELRSPQQADPAVCQPTDGAFVERAAADPMLASNNNEAETQHLAEFGGHNSFEMAGATSERALVELEVCTSGAQVPTTIAATIPSAQTATGISSMPSEPEGGSDDRTDKAGGCISAHDATLDAESRRQPQEHEQEREQEQQQRPSSSSSAHCCGVLTPKPLATTKTGTNLVTWRSELFIEPASTEEEVLMRVKQSGFKENELRCVEEVLEATRSLFEPHQHQKNNSSLDDIVFFCDLALRCLIKTVKKIGSFKALGMDDQIVLLKNACFKILIVRSSLSYRDEIEAWVNKDGTVKPLSSLKTDKANNYGRHKELLDKLAPPLRRDRLVMALLILALLFDPTANLKHTNSVTLDNVFYLCMLRKYLVANQPEPLAKYERLVDVLHVATACNEEYNLFFSRRYQPEQITPLLIEIFDISVNE